MSWLRRLLGRDSAAADDAPEPEAEEELREVCEADWVEFEQALARLLETDLARFAAEHSDEEFCALGLDCNAAYCDVLLSANTTTRLRESAVECSADASGASIRAEMEERRWGFGDWKYHGFNLSVDGDWERYHSILPGGDELHTPEDCDRFLLAATRALLVVAQGEAIERLRRSPDFDIACVDHDEDFAVASARMRQARSDATD